jgi:hypothetical protein
MSLSPASQANSAACMQIETMSENHGLKPGGRTSTKDTTSAELRSAAGAGSVYGEEKTSARRQFAVIADDKAMAGISHAESSRYNKMRPGSHRGPTLTMTRKKWRGGAGFAGRTYQTDHAANAPASVEAATYPEEISKSATQDSERGTGRRHIKQARAAAVTKPPIVGGQAEALSSSKPEEAIPASTEPPDDCSLAWLWPNPRLAPVSFIAQERRLY